MPPVSPPGPLPEPFRIGSPRNQSAPEVSPSHAALLYRQLRDLHLDPSQVFKIREASIEREDIHITLDDGIIAFTQAVDGRITGAFFEGEGEVLLIPPDRVERRSLGFFTKAAILEEQFNTAFFRFNDDLATYLQASLRGPADDPQAFVDKWNTTVTSLAETDAVRLLTSFLNAKKGPDGKLVIADNDRMLRARFAGEHLGVFDLFFDTDAREQISVGQLARDRFGRSFFNVWTAFPMRSKRMKASAVQTAHRYKTVSPAALGSTSEEEPEDRLRILSYRIKVNIKPPTDIDADCVMNAEVAQGGQRVILFELSRFLKVSSIELNGKPLEFLQNEALEGTALERRGNDLVALIFPEALVTGEKLQLRFVYGGPVMSDVGGGLLYVGARGIWYPNRGVSMANFDLQFTYPNGWTLVATGHRVENTQSESVQTSRWTTDRPIPLAGFNFGHYQVADAKLGNIPIEVYATQGVEDSLPAPKQEVVAAPFSPLRRNPADATATMTIPVAPPSPSAHAKLVAGRVERGLASLSDQLGPYPYRSLVLSQLPGRMSQGWPGLIFLSSYSFLSPEEMQRAHISPTDAILFSELMPIHETAHQWWGDLVGWKSYRDQWLVEALANYCALVAMEKDQPREVEQILLGYRRALLAKTPEGRIGADAGPVTLGVRLYSSFFPNGYDAISYGRGTWLFHMLRMMLRDTERDNQKAAKDANVGDEPFFRILRRLIQSHEGKPINNRIVQQAFEENLPPSLRYEGRKSLDWFFDEWVNGTAIPKIQAENVKVTKTANGRIITGKLLQEDAPPELITSVPIYGIADGKNLLYLGRVFADGLESTFRLTAPANVSKIEVDPYLTILRRN
jgi:hypothetical protein